MPVLKQRDGSGGAPGGGRPSHPQRRHAGIYHGLELSTPVEHRNPGLNPRPGSSGGILGWHRRVSNPPNQRAIPDGKSCLNDPSTPEDRPIVFFLDPPMLIQAVSPAVVAFRICTYVWKSFKSLGHGMPEKSRVEITESQWGHSLHNNQRLDFNSRSSQLVVITRLISSAEGSCHAHKGRPWPGATTE